MRAMIAILIAIPWAQVLCAAVPVLEALPSAPVPVQEKRLVYPEWIVGPPEPGSPEMVNGTAPPPGPWWEEDDLDKRQTVIQVKLKPYQCIEGRKFTKAICNGNGIQTYCKEPNAPTRAQGIDGSQPCPENTYCIENFENSNPPRAACVSIARLYHLFLDGNRDLAQQGLATKCLDLTRYGPGYNAVGKSGNFRVSSAVRRDDSKGPYAPYQITLTDQPGGSNIQAVGAADVQNGEFLSKVFKFVGRVVKQCVEINLYSKGPASIQMYSALIAI